MANEVWLYCNSLILAGISNLGPGQLLAKGQFLEINKLRMFEVGSDSVRKIERWSRRKRCANRKN